MKRELLKLIKRKVEFEKRMKKYRKYNWKIASTGEDMYQYIDYVNRLGIDIFNIVEIGANFAQDAEVLMQGFNVLASEVYVFEAHPQIFNVINELHEFHAYNYAVYNEKKEMQFNINDISAQNTGLSSLRDHYDRTLEKKVVVQSIRMDEFMEEESINNIGFCKIDAEGCNYEVLQGFGEYLNNISVIQIEAEHIEKYIGEKTFDEISNLLRSYDFELMLFERKGCQSDSLWVQKKLL